MQGSCECGAVEFDVSGPFGESIACHCASCRKTSGHFWVAFSVDKSSLRLGSGDALSWYESADGVRRGFCAECGSSLFYEFTDHKFVGVAGGSIDGPTGQKLSGHIFTDQMGDYYDLSDSLPKFPRHNDRGYGNE